MVLDERTSPRRLALAGFLVAIVTSLLVGTVSLEDAWREAIVRAVEIGIGCAIGFYLYQSAQRNAGTAE